MAMHMDDRLIHGQVVNDMVAENPSWRCSNSNELVFNNKIRRKTMKLAVLRSTIIGLRTVDEAIEFLNSPQNASYRVMVWPMIPLQLIQCNGSLRYFFANMVFVCLFKAKT